MALRILEVSAVFDFLCQSLSNSGPCGADPLPLDKSATNAASNPIIETRAKDKQVYGEAEISPLAGTLFPSSNGFLSFLDTPKNLH